MSVVSTRAVRGTLDLHWTFTVHAGNRCVQHGYVEVVDVRPEVREHLGRHRELEAQVVLASEPHLPAGSEDERGVPVHDP